MYHLKRILHDWSDHSARIILKHVVSAMDPKRSKVLIMDAVSQPQPPKSDCRRSHSIPGSPINRYLAFKGNGRSLHADLWWERAKREGVEKLARKCGIGH